MEALVQQCRAVLADGILTLQNDRIRRAYAWNEGHLIGREIVDLATGRSWALAGTAPDCVFPGQEMPLQGGQLDVVEQAETPLRPAHLQVDVTTQPGALEVRRRFRIYPGCPAIACDLYLRGSVEGGWDAPPTLERLSLPGRHLRLECVQFYDITDRRNTLVSRRSALVYWREGQLAGNLLLIGEPTSDDGLFVLKEAPCSDVQLAWPGYDFTHRIGEIAVVGIGVTPGDLCAEEWTRCYGAVTGVAGGGELGLLSALRTYQEQIRTHEPGRDEMILLNTWGDRGQDTRIRESFALAELEQGARLGITHFQLDDGWQSGQTSNSAYAGGSLEGIWARDDYWAPHPERFPSGLAPVVERARALGIEPCVWFNPSKEDSYAHWEADAEVLIDLYRQHSIRTYKIDGVVIPDKEADRNLRAMFERVMEATGSEAVFNLDVTAGQRWGYHYGNEYGNIFLENRYTDWRNYYPHWTLRNLWMLSRYLPAQNLQIEFLNKWRNPGNYPADDPLAPERVPFAYCFAVTVAAQPLAWFEATGLPEEAFAIAPLIRTYREHQVRLHAGQILPIGEEPSGTGWTGFQSMGEGSGYLLLYREWNEREEARIALWGLAGATLRCTHLAGQGAEFTTEVGPEGEITVRLPAPFTFALYRYEVY
jgi:alpha-galactosidase